MTPGTNEYWRATSTAYCANNFEAWGSVGVSTFSSEYDFIQQVRYLSPVGEALVAIVRQGLPIMLDRFGAASVRAHALEEVIREYLDREHNRLEKNTVEASAPPKSRRI